MKAKYFIIKYEKHKKSVLAMLYAEAGYHEGTDTYTLTLQRKRLFGLLKDTVTRKVNLPRGFDHVAELESGRQFIF